jgi:type II secretory ATPase GspE/PulE/Tfp pilus assembly ATPase PilB-like protein
LRSILRHDPDVVLVGEIRDEETAQIAVQASLTGHLVFSTLHTNDAPGALTRLVDMGVEPYLVASSLESVIAQRLVRVLCPQCKGGRQQRERSRRCRSGWRLRAATILWRRSAARRAARPGFQGRQALVRVDAMTPEVRQLLLRSASSGEIKEVARREGMRTADRGRLAPGAAPGVTSTDEVLRVAKYEESNWLCLT